MTLNIKKKIELFIPKINFKKKKIYSFILLI